MTVGELSRQVTRMEKELDDGIKGLHRRLDELNYVHPETFAMQKQLEDAHRQDLERRITQLESNNQWLWRTVVGLVLALVLAGITAAAGLPT